MNSSKKLRELKKKKYEIKKKINLLEKELIVIDQELLEMEQNLENSDDLVKRKSIEKLTVFEIEVKNLDASWRPYKIIPFPKKHRMMFPGYKVNFELQTDIGIIRNIHVSGDSTAEQRRNKSKAGHYLCGGLKDWFTKHRELRDGDKLLFTVIETHRKYKLYIIN